MRMGDIRLPKNAGRIISSANQQYRLELGFVAVESAILTLNFNSTSNLSGSWTFSKSFATPPVVHVTINQVFSSINLTDLGGIRFFNTTTTGGQVALIRSASSSKTFTTADTATVYAIAIGEAP